YDRLSSRYGPAVTAFAFARSDEPVVNGKIIIRHAPGREAALEGLADVTAVESGDFAQRPNSLGLVVDDKPGNAVLHDFGHRSPPERDHWRAAGHRLDHHEPEWLWPVDRKQQRDGFAEEFLFLRVIHLADETDLLV